MQKPKVGSVVILEKDLSTKDISLQKGILGIVRAVEEDKKSWGIKTLIVDFGMRNGQLLKHDFDDMSFVNTYVIPKKQKDSVAVKL
jgi:hypothetical protein